MANALKFIDGDNGVCAVEDMPSAIEKWMKVYKSKADWASYTYVGAMGSKRTHRRRMLNVAKEVCSEYANLAWAEMPNITYSIANVETKDTELQTVLDNNDIDTNMRIYIEYMAALGGFAIKPYVVNGKIKLDFITADKFKVTRFDGETAMDAEFYSKIKIPGSKGSNDFIDIVERHTFKDNIPVGITEDGDIIYSEGSYMNILFTGFYKGKQISLVEKLPDMFNDMNIETYIPSFVPSFVYIKTPIANNLVIGDGHGISIFANALGVIQQIDTAFDTLDTELVLGKKRIIVPATAMRTIITEEGVTLKYFDMSDEVYVAMDFEDGKSQAIVDNTQELRTVEIVQAINMGLEMLSLKTGFSAGTFTFDSRGLKTATEIVSDNTKTMKTKKNLEKELARGLKDLVVLINTYIAYVNDSDYIDVNIAINWFDGVIESDSDRLDKYSKLYANGLISKKRAIKLALGCTDDEALTIMQEIETEKKGVVVNV